MSSIVNPVKFATIRERGLLFWKGNLRVKEKFMLTCRMTPPRRALSLNEA
jgi:hypothetical protein